MLGTQVFRQPNLVADFNRPVLVAVEVADLFVEKYQRFCFARYRSRFVFRLNSIGVSFAGC